MLKTHPARGGSSEKVEISKGRAQLDCRILKDRESGAPGTLEGPGGVGIKADGPRHPGGSVSGVSYFGSRHDLMVCGFEPRIGLCADGSEPGACFGFCVSLSLCPSPAHARSPSVSKINKHSKKIVFKLNILHPSDWHFKKREGGHLHGSVS